jgi:hypothetical protein
MWNNQLRQKIGVVTSVGQRADRVVRWAPAQRRALS